ncbi:MAG: sugar transferase [Acidobacteria bacterium]|nr:sugar transferase [Acidobacteriota bacterium]
MVIIRGIADRQQGSLSGMGTLASASRLCWRDAPENRYRFGMGNDSLKASLLQATTRTQARPLGRRFRPPSLGLRISERKLLLVLFDLLAVNAALFIALADRPKIDPTFATFYENLHWFVLVSGVWIGVSVFLNVYDLMRASNALYSVLGAGGAALFTGLVYLFIPFLTPELPRSRFEALLFPLLAMLSVSAWRILYARVFVQPVFHHRSLIVGADESGRTLAQIIATISGGNGGSVQGAGYQILGWVDDEEKKQGLMVEGIPVLGAGRDLLRLVRELHPDQIIVAITEWQPAHDELFQAVLDCREMGISVTTMTNLFERLTGRVPVEYAGRDLCVVLPLAEPATHRFYLTLRRVVDILISSLGCIFLAAIIPFVWLANRVSSPGPLFYRQERIGRSGHPFVLFKFRSMIVDAEKYTGAVWAKEADHRVTPMGHILRKTRLDELPQVWNILRGEMSLIGPRPERPEFVARLAHELPFYRMRHAVRPGLTGWAQVKYRYGASVNDALIKLQYDLYYIKYQGPYIDLLILLKTIQVVLGFKGR